jgi:hypothetical protein
VSRIVIVDAAPPACTKVGANVFVPVMFESAATTSVACAAWLLPACEDDAAEAGIVLT